MSMKNSNEPATFRFVAQNLNHCATAVPAPNIVRAIKSKRMWWAVPVTDVGERINA